MANIEVTLDNMSKLTEKAFKECLLKKGEDRKNCVKIEGIQNKFEFNSQRLEEKRGLVTALLENLPAEFEGGDSFLNLCITKEEKLWTGMHYICEELMCMAIGLKLMKYCFPKEVWTYLPGGVPYVMITWNS